MSRKPPLWKRGTTSPFLKPIPDSLAEEAVTTPDVLNWRGCLVLYVGAISGRHERLLVTDLQPPWLNEGSTHSWTDKATVAVDTGPSCFDRLHVFDPASVVVDGKISLYYSAVGPDGDVIGKAMSHDGRTFTKGRKPVIEGRAPEIVYFNRQYYLFFVKETPSGGYAIFSSVSADGEDFSQESVRLVFDIGRSEAWDCFEVTTPRIFERKDVFYMVYAGQSDPALKDIPHAFGLARSSDLITWERYPGNPVFRKGQDGSWDDGAIWFGTVFAWDDRLYLIYEGGTAEAILQPGPTLTQVGLASIACDTFDARMASWSASA
jgi:hypothetical protein